MKQRIVSYAGKSYVSDLLSTQFGRDDQFVYDWDSNVGTYISKIKTISAKIKSVT